MTPFILSTAALVVLAPTLASAQQADRGTLVVVNKGADSANLIDLGTRTIVATVPTGTGPHEVTITSDGRTAVVTDYGGRGGGGNTLTVIDVPGQRAARTIDLGEHRRPHGILYLPGDSLVAVTSETSRHVVVVHVARGAIVRAVPTEQGGSHMVAVAEDGITAFTGNIRDNSVSQLDLATGAHVKTLPAPPEPEAITVTREGDEVWVGSNSEGTVSVINPVGGAIETAAEGFGWPYRILITPDRRLVIIPDLGRHEIRFLDHASRNELGRIELPGAGPQGVTLSGDGATLFLSLSRQNRVAIIDLASREIVGYLPTGTAPDGVAYSPIVYAR